ncbi:hypothetical protein BDV39DRAFT_177578 [Aspergillus sergii]|uniref:Uncharacterized protein n=1 Tax=Aspergillus sergii TaxID=1034303 RepID=A0A5N6WYU6_9EURO|nr:hypothetical protein BDV39DRAFT_177578 [Aspergillus sergii]
MVHLVSPSREIQGWHLRLGFMWILYMSFEITVVHSVLVLLGQVHEERTESPGMGTYLVQDASVCQPPSIMQSTSCLSQEVTSKIKHEIFEKGMGTLDWCAGKEENKF